ncbi:Uncharacterised protein [Legionella steigerwaltii]|uniref:Uncharacterized protein n=1 Tax=Legionella steigerwaltii TaxID=460 RepID=A0A378LG37_9GAMM|nr:hypothetical protein [Legionella steigerwaltii]KTD77741.1 hypothetical protein Lstg_2098 [Legionella steigerwaltii]STY23051.1 Uncharacterised protein [Legionella steigerwaltii]
MLNKKIVTIFIFVCFFMLSVSGHTKTNNIQFFYSNNNQILDLEKAYQRLIGKEQRQLKKNATHALQKQHMELGEFRNALGTYTLQEKKLFTAENSEIFFVSPLQNLSRKKTFIVASMLAKQLDQESVAVFIPNDTSAIAHIKLVFSYNKLTISEVTQLIHKLPASLTHAFTLRLKNTHSGFDSIEVHSIEWLGNNLNSSVITNLFPFDTVLSYRGDSYLVFKTGSYQKL